MKRPIFIIIVCVVVTVLGIMGAKILLFDDINEKATKNQSVYISEDEQVELEDVDMSEPLKTYSNGLASFVYDSTKLAFQEMPSDNENGFPMTSFYPIESIDPLPRLDIIPLVLSEPFQANMPNSDWENFAKTLILAYYNTTEREAVKISLSNTTIKFNDSGVKMFLNFESELSGSATPNMTGAIRLVANDTRAIVTLALVQQKGAISKEMQDTYMSARLES